MFGFIISLASGSFPGTMCFVFRDDGYWGRHVELKMAHVFDSREEAEAVLKEMAAEIRYQAPELNNSLAARLAQANIIPLPE